MGIIEDILNDFDTKGFESWLHIEPHCRSEDLSQGIEACTADPLWMLARQWQMGEFKGEDNGSPIQVKVSHRTDEINEVKLGEGRPIDLANAPPLEAIVERESVEMDWRTRVMVGQQFERLLRSKFDNDADAVICEYRKKFPVERPASSEEVDVDRATMRFLQLMEGRAIDGGKLLEKIQEGTVPPLPDGVSVGKNMLEKAHQEVMDWFDRLYTVPEDGEGSAWQSQRLEYKSKVSSFNGGYLFSWDEIPGNDNEKLIDFLKQNYNLDWLREEKIDKIDNDKIIKVSVENNYLSLSLNNQNTKVNLKIDDGRNDEFIVKTENGKLNIYNGGKTSLVAPEYRNGELDWYHFMVEGVPEPFNGNFNTSHFTPTCIEIPGMPVRRWWEFEDGNVDLGDLNVESVDLAKMALMDFVFVYGDDWFLVPLTVPIGSLTRINEIEVNDVFGVKTPITKRSRDSDGESLDHWDMFSLSRAGHPAEAGRDDFLFIPPVLSFREESKPFEEVHFMRDEGANMVWAEEYMVRNGLGNPVEGFDAQNERREREMEGPSTGASQENSSMPVYRLAGTVPDNWIPYVPVHAGKSGLKDIDELFSIRLRQAEMMSKDNDHEPMTSILNRGDLKWINEESVPRAGVKVQLTKQRVRWIDGKTYVWLGRKVVTGKGEESSGLRFDIINYGSTKKKE